MMFTLLISIIVVGIIVVLVRGLPKSNCTGNCNQGRNCTCQNNK
jgi:hypothetical protein